MSHGGVSIGSLASLAVPLLCVFMENLFCRTRFSSVVSVINYEIVKKEEEEVGRWVGGSWRRRWSSPADEESIRF